MLERPIVLPKVGKSLAQREMELPLLVVWKRVDIRPQRLHRRKLRIVAGEPLAVGQVPVESGASWLKFNGSLERLTRILDAPNLLQGKADVRLR